MYEWATIFLALCAVTRAQTTTIQCPLDSNGVVNLTNEGLTFIDADIFEIVYDCKPLVANITSLDLSYNQIRSVDSDSFARFYELQILNISHNSITLLDNNTFIPLRGLQVLDVSYNSLTKLEAGLISLVNLVQVWFNNNNISQVDPEIVGQDNVALTYFNMDNNSLTYLDPWPYTTYQSYQRRVTREFSFQHNAITTFANYMNWAYDLHYPFEVYVNIQFNKLQTLSLDMLRQFDRDLAEESAFAAFLTYQMNITNNPFFCDCNLYTITDIVRSGVFRYSRVEEYRYRCGYPASNAGMDYLHDISLDQLICNVTTDCPPGCRCEDRPHNDTFFIDCSNSGLEEIPETIPQHSRSKIEMILDNNRISSLKYTNYTSKLTNISLANNLIEELDTDIIRSLNVSRLDLRNNRISNLPKEIRKYSYSTVFLNGNPLRCDCNSMWLVDWLSLDRDIGDTSLSCDSKTGTIRILDMTLKDLGCTNELLIIICSCLGAIFLALVVFLIFAKRCPYETKVVINKLFRFRIGNKYKPETDNAKEVDIYLVFDSECEDVIGWVRYFTKKLNKKKPVYSILNPSRFTEPGSQAENITKWVGKSRTVLVILSEKIFNREWRCSEIDEAERLVIEAAAAKSRNSTDETPEAGENDFDRLNDCEQGRPNTAQNIEMESVQDAPKIIYVIFNSSDLLKAKLDEDKWIKRVGLRREIRDRNREVFDLRAKAWQEKLQEEPWKSRLAGKKVLSPDDRMFWSKLRYELPPTGHGVGDGNFNFRRENTTPEEPRRDNVNTQRQGQGETVPKLAVLKATNETPRVHKKHQGGFKNNQSGKCSTSKHDNVMTLQSLEDNNGGNITIMSRKGTSRESKRPDLAKTGGVGLLNALRENNRKPGGQANGNQTNAPKNVERVLANGLMNALGRKKTNESNSRPGSADSRNSDSDPIPGVFTIDGTSNLKNALRFSRTMANETSSSHISLSSTSSS